MGGQRLIFSGDRDKLTWMMNNIIEELLDLEVEPWSPSCGGAHNMMKMGERWKWEAEG